MTDRRCPYCRGTVAVNDREFLAPHRFGGGGGLPLCYGAGLHAPTLDAVREAMPVTHPPR